jgi:uncharacterized membrane protein YqaE (UPF0057 family)
MGILLALFAPPISLFASGRPGSALLCLVLQLTLIGWIPAAIWAVVARSESIADKRADRIISSSRRT